MSGSRGCWMRRLPAKPSWSLRTASRFLFHRLKSTPSETCHILPHQHRLNHRQTERLTLSRDHSPLAVTEDNSSTTPSLIGHGGTARRSSFRHLHHRVWRAKDCIILGHNGNTTTIFVCLSVTVARMQCNPTIHISSTPVILVESTIRNSVNALSALLFSSSAT